jgi:hypothetical protein
LRRGPAVARQRVRRCAGLVAALALLGSICGCPAVRPKSGQSSPSGRSDEPGPPSVLDPSLLDRG